MAGFVEQIGHLCRGHAAAVYEEFEPILGFLDFLETVANLGDELGLGSGARCFAVVCTNRCSGTKNLLVT